MRTHCTGMYILVSMASMASERRTPAHRLWLAFPPIQPHEPIHLCRCCSGAPTEGGLAHRHTHDIHSYARTDRERVTDGSVVRLPGAVSGSSFCPPQSLSASPRLRPCIGMRLHSAICTAVRAGPSHAAMTARERCLGGRVPDGSCMSLSSSPTLVVSSIPAPKNLWLDRLPSLQQEGDRNRAWHFHFAGFSARTIAMPNSGRVCRVLPTADQLLP